MCYVIAIHGGAGALPYRGMTIKREGEYKDGLLRAVNTGATVLKGGGTALEAVERALIVLENNPLFNAGIGSAINTHGRIEMDASIMCGKTLKAGAVSCVSNIRNPIVLARLTMEHSSHLFLSSRGAEEFAAEMGLELVDNEVFRTEERMAWWRDKKDKSPIEYTEDSGTAGAVALDSDGNLASGTSTGGLMFKRKGRVGDSAIIGAGTYANNATCAVSCSGTGENIIRAVAAHEISSLLKYSQLTLAEACEKTMQEKLTPFEGQAGLVALDKEGNVKFVFNTPRMYRAFVKQGGKPQVRLYRD